MSSMNAACAASTSRWSAPATRSSSSPRVSAIPVRNSGGSASRPTAWAASNTPSIQGFVRPASSRSPSIPLAAERPTTSKNSRTNGRSLGPDSSAHRALISSRGVCDVAASETRSSRCLRSMSATIAASRPSRESKWYSSMRWLVPVPAAISRRLFPVMPCAAAYSMTPSSNFRRASELMYRMVQ